MRAERFEGGREGEKGGTREGEIEGHILRSTMKQVKLRVGDIESISVSSFCQASVSLLYVTARWIFISFSPFPPTLHHQQGGGDGY